MKVSEFYKKTTMGKRLDKRVRKEFYPQPTFEDVEKEFEGGKFKGAFWKVVAFGMHLSGVRAPKDHDNSTLCENL